jgi:hypothetical protein
MCISWSFDAARFSEAVHLDELDDQAHHDMPGIADKPLVRYQDKTPYPEIKATCKAKEVYRGIDCEIEISQAAKKYSLSYVSKSRTYYYQRNRFNDIEDERTRMEDTIAFCEHPRFRLSAC